MPKSPRPPAPLRTENLNVLELLPLITPRQLKYDLPATPRLVRSVIRSREEVRAVLAGRDRRLLVVVGPCSIHDPKAALDYARRLRRLREELADTLLILMRVYFEKPRTTTGWKGLIYDPHMDGSSDIAYGLQTARELLLAITGLGIPLGTEMLDPIVPQYTADLISWVGIGARTTESQTHRQMASGLSMPVGFKNLTDGNVQVAVDAMESSRHAHSFLGIDEDGRIAIVRTAGNVWGHLILRGSRTGPNYAAEHVADAARRMQAADLQPVLMVDCSHGNAGKRHEVQPDVWADVLAQRARGTTAIIGMLLESNLHAGSQAIPKDPRQLRYGVSVTDECVNWATTEKLLRQAARTMRKLLPRA